MTKLVKTFLNCLSFAIIIGTPVIANSQGQDMAWPLKTIDEFFSDPVNNFEYLKKEPDLRNKLELFIRYNLDKTKDGLKILLEQPDQLKSEILIYLLVIYPEYVIADAGAEFFSRFPDLFVNQLKKYSEWKEVINEVSKREELFYAGLEKLGNTEFEKEIKDYSIRLKGQRDYEYEIVSSFIEDPVNNFEKIKSLENFENLIYQYQKKFIKDGILTDSPFDRLLDNLKSVNEKTIQIVIYLVKNIQSGYFGELVVEKASEVFVKYPDAFLEALERTNDWQKIIESMYYLNPEEVGEGLNTAKDSEFASKVRKHIKERR